MLLLCNNFKERIKYIIASDQAFTFMSGNKSTPAFWKEFLFHILAIIKKLGCSTFLYDITGLRWNELVSIISEINNLKLIKEYIEKM